MNASERLAAIRERVEKATPGPWEVSVWAEHMANAGHASGVYALDEDGEDGDEVCDLPSVYASREGDADMEFIAHAREDVPYLLDRVERLEAALRDTHDIVKNGRGVPTAVRSAVAYNTDVALRADTEADEEVIS